LRPRNRAVSLAVIIVLAAALRLWGITFGLPHTLTRPDEDATVSIAVGLFSRSLNPHFFDWPTLFMSAIAVAFGLYYWFGRGLGWYGSVDAFVAEVSQQPAPLFRIARVVSAATGVLTVATVHAIGLQLFDRITGLVAAFLLASTALHVRDSHFGVTDIAATWLITVSFLFTARFADGGRRSSAIAAGVCAGLAASTKYNAGLIVLPAVWAIWRSRDRARGWLIAACCLAAGIAFIAGTPYALVDRGAFVAALGSISSHLRGGHAAMAGPGWFVHLSSSLRYGMGVPQLVVGIAGLVLYVWRDPRAGVLFCVFPVIYYALIGGGQTAFARYILPVIPFLCLAAAYLVVEVGRGLANAVGRSRAAAALAWCLGVAVSLPSLLATIQSDHLLAQQDSRLLAAEWILAHYPNGTTIAQTGTVAAQVQMAAVDATTAAKYGNVGLDRATGAFPASSGAGMPQIVIVEECALPYCSVSDGLRAALRSDYDVQHAVTATDLRADGLVYDRDDDFYLPLAGFDAVVRPGPNITIYARRSGTR
jgi:hypothetical protein